MSVSPYLDPKYSYEVKSAWIQLQEEDLLPDTNNPEVTTESGQSLPTMTYIGKDRYFISPSGVPMFPIVKLSKGALVARSQEVTGDTFQVDIPKFLSDYIKTDSSKWVKLDSVGMVMFFREAEMRLVKRDRSHEKHGSLWRESDCDFYDWRMLSLKQLCFQAVRKMLRAPKQT